MHLKLKIYITAAALLLSTGLLWAQQKTNPGKNILSKKELNWKVVSSEHFDVYYYNADPVLATQAARYAEESLFDISQLLDYKNNARFALYVYLSPYDLAQSNRFPEAKYKEGGFTPVNDNAGNVMYQGGQKNFQQEVKTQVSELLMKDFYFGGGIQATIQNTVLLHSPDWFFEGFNAYVGQGWDFEDELWISSLENANMLQYALEGNQEVNRVARKSIWYFIGSRYGVEKLSEIFYMTRLTHSVEAGIIHVLGITLKTLTERWREFMLQRITENHTYRDVFTEKSRHLNIPKSDRLEGFALHPSQPLVALHLRREGKQRVVLYDLDKGEMQETGIEGGFKTEQFEGFELEFPMEWSPNGRFLFTTLYQDGYEDMVFYDLRSEEAKYFDIHPTLDRVFQAAWSHDSKKMVISGLRGGMVDLYTLAPLSNRFRPLTEDLFDDFNPVWSPDDQSIYYASTRHTDSVEVVRAPFDVYNQNLDVFQYDLQAKSLRRVTDSPEWSEWPMAMVSSFEMVYLTNRSGIRNLEKVNVFLGETENLTNLDRGMYRSHTNDSLTAFSIPVKGQLQMMVADNQSLWGDQVVLNSKLRMYYAKRYKRLRSIEDLKSRADSLRKVKEEMERLAIENAKVDSVPKDSVKKEEPAVKFYVFDDEDDEKQKERQNRRRLLRNNSKKKKQRIQKPEFEKIAVSSPKRSPVKWSTSDVVTAFSYDPVYKLSTYVEAGLQDLENNHRIRVGFRPFINLRSSDVFARYEYNKKRTDFYAGILREARYLEETEYQLRFNNNKLYVGARYPFSRFADVSVTMHGALMNRRNINLLVPSELDGQDFVAGSEILFRYDNREIKQTFVKKGNFVQLSANQLFSFTNKQNHFVTAKLDARKYQPIMKNFVLAGRLTAAGSFGPNVQQFFMGGVDDWLFSNFNNFQDFPVNQDVNDVFNMEYVSPIRGFQFNARNGSKYIAANLELRIPVSRMITSSLNSNPLFNVELIPFFDFGTVWDEGNPLSQKNPIDTETINSYPLTITIQTLKSPFLMGFGTGMRLMLLGYNVRFDMGWGVEDYTVLKPRLHLSLGKNF